MMRHKGGCNPPAAGAEGVAHDRNREETPP